jgi:hypothetical protein
LIAVDVEEGHGYRISDELFKAMAIRAAKRANQAEQN